MSTVRIKFKKEGSAKYISHLDLIRTIQRAVRRADIPIEYTKGFNPHAKISYGPALAVGMSSCGEYLDMELNMEMGQFEMMERLNNSLPQGIRVTAASTVPDNAPSLASVIDAAGYSITGQVKGQDEHSEKKLKSFFSLRHALIQRTDKKGRIKQVDIMPLILEVEKILTGAGGVTLEVILAAGSRANLKPAHLIKAIEQETGIILEGIKIHRRGLFIKKGQNYLSPLEVFN
jgi:radical SAM-linked protein